MSKNSLTIVPKLMVTFKYFKWINLEKVKSESSNDIFSDEVKNIFMYNVFTCVWLHFRHRTLKIN